MFDIAHELSIAAPPEKVFAALTTKDGVSKWFTTDCELAPEAGTEVSLWFENHTIGFTMMIDILEPPEAVHWDCLTGPEEWPGTKIAFRVEANRAADPEQEADRADEGTVESSTLRLWHGNWEYEDGVLPRCSFEWAMYLDSLRRYLETGTGSPAS